LNKYYKFGGGQFAILNLTGSRFLQFRGPGTHNAPACQISIQSANVTLSYWWFNQSHSPVFRTAILYTTLFTNIHGSRNEKNNRKKERTKPCYCTN